MSSYRVFSPIESFCAGWPQARFVVTSLLPDEMEFEATPGGTVCVSTDFVHSVLKSVPERRASILNELGDRFTWVAKCMPMTLPTPVELQHFNGLVLTPAVLTRIRSTLRQHQATRYEMGLPTMMQLLHHGLGLFKCPVPIDPDW